MGALKRNVNWNSLIKSKNELWISFFDSLDESLVINQEEMLKHLCCDQPKISSCSLAASKESLKTSSLEDQHQVKTADSNPSFIRTMELSKFSTLTSTRAHEEPYGVISEMWVNNIGRSKYYLFFLVKCTFSEKFDIGKKTNLEKLGVEIIMWLLRE